MPTLFLRLILVLMLASPLASHASRLLVFGEMHDQPDQQRQVAEEVRSLAAAGRLAALVLEMAEAPHNTAALPRDATEAQARDALNPVLGRRRKSWPSISRIWTRHRRRCSII